MIHHPPYRFRFRFFSTNCFLDRFTDNKRQAAGACAFAFCMAGWYILFAQLLLTLDFPFTLPIGDLSDRIIQAASKKKSADQTK